MHILQCEVLLKCCAALFSGAGGLKVLLVGGCIQLEWACRLWQDVACQHLHYLCWGLYDYCVVISCELQNV